MTPGAVASLVAQVHVAAGRDYGETHFVVYGKALHLVSDDVGLAAADVLIRQVSWDKPPSVGLVMEVVQAIQRQRELAIVAIPEATGEPVSREKSLEWVRRIRDEHGTSAMVDSLECMAQAQPG